MLFILQTINTAMTASFLECYVYSPDKNVFVAYS